MWPRFGRPHRDGASLNVSDPADPAPVDPRAVDRAYEEGLAEGRRLERRRHSHPIRNLMIGLVALAGGAMLGVAAWYGSFGKGGEVVDQKLAVAADRAEPTLRAAADEAGQALSSAGRGLQPDSEVDDPTSSETPALNGQDL